MTDIIDTDTFDRTILFSLHNGTKPTLEAALDAHARSTLTIVADTGTLARREGQAAALTAVATAVRAFGIVHFVTDGGDTMVLGGPQRGLTVAEVVTAEGATISGGRSSTSTAILIGNSVSVPVDHAGLAVRSTWTNWTATVSPGTETQPPPPSGNVVAAIAAGALAVDEAFNALFLGNSSDSGHRTISLNLWEPDATVPTVAPELQWAPPSWWLVGLGHLGQGFAWVLSWLDYEVPAEVSFILQDTDRTVPANHSTGILTPKESDGVRKTRLIAHVLENIGFSATQIIERRLDDATRATPEERNHVALIGIDNLNGRQLISEIGWDYAIDIGLGNTDTNFDSISLHRFPGHERSDEIPGWKTTAGETIVPKVPAFEDLTDRFDQCGVVELAGKAVGASFVGVIAATLAIAEPLRELHGGEGTDRLRYDARFNGLIRATADEVGNLHAVRLRP